VPSFNRQNAAYSNGTLWNYTSYDVSAYKPGDKLSCCGFATDGSATSSTNCTANVTMSNHDPVITGTTITNPLYSGDNATGTVTATDYEGDELDCVFEWYVNGTLEDTDTQTPCINTSIFDSSYYGATDIVWFNVTVTDSYGATDSEESTHINVSGDFAILNTTWTATQYEELPYDYTITFRTRSPTDVPTTTLNYNGYAIATTCTNVGILYDCHYNNLLAPPVQNNNTLITGTWNVSVDDGFTTTDYNSSFNTTIRYGIWATNFSSDENVVGGRTATLNVTYANVSGFGPVGFS
jgi:hypothetical protein